MILVEDDLIHSFLAKPTIFICGQKESLTKHTIHELLILKLQKPLEHLYFVQPNEEVLNMLKFENSEDNYSIVEDIDQIQQIAKFNIIACGFSADSKVLFDIVKGHRKKVLIFFNRLGIFRNTWDRLTGEIHIKEHGFDDFINERTHRNPLYEESLHESQWNESDFFFTNRGKQLNQYRDFKADIRKRCCKIVGLKGMGKRTFIRKMKISGLSNTVSHFCINSDDDISYILKPLLERFGVVYKESKIPTSLHPYRVDPILRKLFVAFDQQENATLLFLNMDILFDKKRREFHDSNIAFFFKHLLSRASYKGNKVYVTSEHNLTFRDVKPNLIQKIYIDAMTGEYIKYILEHEFGKRNAADYATGIMRYDDKTVDQLIGGYPPIAHVFVDVCEEYSPDDVISGGFAYPIFIKRKKTELQEYIKLSSEETSILGFLSLFRKDFTINAAKTFNADIEELLEHLHQRMFVEKERHQTYTSYYVTGLIQDYVLSVTSEAEKKKNHNLIADYYWEQAESQNIQTYQQIESYRLALYHYEQANNLERRDLLIKRFSGIFINRAYRLYQAEKIEEAWQIYSIVYNRGHIADPKHLNIYAVCNALLNKEGTQKVFEHATKTFPKNSFLKLSYANYLFNQDSYDKAEKLCIEAKKVHNDNYVVDNIRAKIMDKKGDHAGALQLLRNQISNFKRKENLNEGERKALLTNYITYFSLIGYFEELQFTIEKTREWLKADGVYPEDFDQSFLMPFPLTVSDKIKSVFQKAIRHKQAQKPLFVNYSEFLRLQGDLQEASEIEKEGLKRGRWRYNWSTTENIIASETLTLLHEHTSTRNRPVDSKERIDIKSPGNASRVSLGKKNLNDSLEAAQYSQTPMQLPSKKITPRTTRVTQPLHQAQICQRIRLCENKINDAQVTVDSALGIDSNHYAPLYAKCNLLRRIEDLKTLKNIVRRCYEKGTEGKLASETAGEDSPVLSLDISKLIDRVGTEKNASIKGQLLEKLICTLFREVRGFEINERVLTKTEEIDIVILNKSDKDPWRKESPVMLVECKNWSSRCGKNELVLFKEKILNRKGRASIGFFISWNGFAKTFAKEDLRSSHCDILVVPVTGEQIIQAVAQSSFQQSIEEWWLTAISS